MLVEKRSSLIFDAQRTPCYRDLGLSLKPLSFYNGMKVF